MKAKQEADRLPVDMLARMADVLKLLGHADRLRILELLDIEGALPVNQVVDILGLPQATVSQHLNRMRRAGLIASERRGVEVWYQVADRDSLTILNCMRKREEQK